MYVSVEGNKPVLGGAVTVNVTTALPPGAIGPGTVQVSNAPSTFRLVQVAPEAAVACIPAGSWSCTIRFVPVVLPPLLVSVSVYWKLLSTTTDAGPVLMTETLGVAVEVTNALSGGEVVVPPIGLLPEAVAVLVIELASMSCWVTT